MPPRPDAYASRPHQNAGRQHQRFSWQLPVEPPSEPNSRGHRQLQRHSRHHHQQIQTNAPQHRDRVFSYAQTPIEHRAHLQTSTPNEPPLPQSPPTPIDPRPQSIYDTTHNKNLPSQPSSPPLSAYLPPYPQDEKPPYFPPLSRHNDSSALSPASPAAESLPAHAQTQQVQALRNSHARQRSNLSPINTNTSQYNTPAMPPTPTSQQAQASPLPQKLSLTPASPSNPEHHPSTNLSPDSRKSHPINEPYSPHGFSSNNTNTRHAVFSPESAHGPNGLDFALHQPGQITHPNMDLTPTGSFSPWKHSLCACNSDVSTCVTGLICPCILYGRTAYRLSQKGAKQDATDMLGHKTMNGHCMLMAVSCGLWWIFPMIQRIRIRHTYKLEGSFMGDVVKGCCCCCCCATVQNEREVKTREENVRRWAGPATKEEYVSGGQMVYQAQN